MNPFPSHLSFSRRDEKLEILGLWTTSATVEGEKKGKTLSWQCGLKRPLQIHIFLSLFQIFFDESRELGVGMITLTRQLWNVLTFGLLSNPCRLHDAVGFRT